MFDVGVEYSIIPKRWFWFKFDPGRKNVWIDCFCWKGEAENNLIAQNTIGLKLFEAVNFEKI
jgi:hypothetical protein